MRSAIREPGGTPWAAGQPSPPQAAPASAFPTRDEIEHLQSRKLQALLKAIIPSNPFYAWKLSALGPPLAPDSLASYQTPGSIHHAA